MPLNILRLNQRQTHPTPHIVFIKPLPGSASVQAEKILSRVAAICHPILTAEHISVTTLEEFPANREFVGRNFNAGECIQLVLRTHSGAWIPFRSVVLVMMHELAHCKQMNHSKNFWKVRNEYAETMRGLWAKGYTGEGLWGRGRELAANDDHERNGNANWNTGNEAPAHLCGGTFRSRGRWKRKRTQLSHAEREQRRIEKKFIKPSGQGQTTGVDQNLQFFLDGGKTIKGKPRVANSARGRELRANAALIRLGAAKVEKEEQEYARNVHGATVKNQKDEPETNVKLETSSDDEGEERSDAEYEDEYANQEDAIDIDGAKLKDSSGGVMIKVCEDEDTDDVQVKQEMDEMNGLWSIPEQSIDVKPKLKTKAKKAGISEYTMPKPGENFYSSPQGQTAAEDESAKGMRDKLDSLHNSGSILTAFRKQEARTKTAAKGKR